MNCDSIARAYRWMEYLTFGPALHRRRREFLKDMGNARSVLILGDGDGRFTADFLQRNPHALVCSLDSSQRMTSLAAGRIARIPNGSARIKQSVEDVRRAQLTGTFDLVVTHFFLDCFTTDEVRHLIRRITAHVLPGGQWVISEFQIPPAGFRRLVAGLAIKLLYAGFRILTGLEAKRLPDYRRILESNDYHRTAIRTGVAGMLVSETWQLVS
ncbi:MAG: class I SAM-dependent methyltransferase [Bryobacteraceae bacterium]